MIEDGHAACRQEDSPDVRVSVLVPVHNEVENVLAVLTGIERVFDATDGVEGPYEVIFVDDASVDGTGQRLAALQGRHPVLRVLRHHRRTGQSGALRTGVRAARGAWIVTLDGDGQNDPADIPALLALAGPDRHGGEPVGMVAGLRRRRRDSWNRRMATRVANTIRQAILGDGCPDSACGLKLFRREVFLSLPYFDGMHRFLPALVQMQGWRVRTVDVNHRPRLGGRSKYGTLRRGLIGIPDLLGVLWLKWRTSLPGAVAGEMRSPGRAAIRGGGEMDRGDGCLGAGQLGDAGLSGAGDVHPALRGAMDPQRTGQA